MTMCKLIKFLMLSTLLIMPVSNLSTAEAAGGDSVFNNKGCVNCHSIKANSDINSSKARVNQKGPDLWFAGSKFKKEWLKTWLQNPTPLLGIKYSNLLPEKGTASHPVLSADEASAATSFLMTLKDDKMVTGIIDDTKKMSRSLQFKTKALFTKKQVCFGCHQFKPRKKSKAKGGFSGPTFVEAGKRLKGDWVYAYLKNQKRYVTFGRMPVYIGTTFKAFSDKELKNLAQYIANLN